MNAAFAIGYKHTHVDLYTTLNNRDKNIPKQLTLEDQIKDLLKASIERTFTYKTILLSRETSIKIDEIIENDVFMPHILWMWLYDPNIHIQIIDRLLKQLAIDEPSEEVLHWQQFFSKIKEMHINYFDNQNQLGFEYVKILESLQEFMNAPDKTFASELISLKYRGNDGKLYHYANN